MTTPLNNKKGTTLVELMVCLVLLALFGTAAVTLVKPCAEAYIEVQQLTRAQNLADALTETIRGELADADGTISIVNAATESDADSANNIFIEDARLTEGTALRFTVESSYTEILDAGYVPKLTATTLNADNTTSTKVLYDPAADTFAELNRYLHMRFYKQTEGKEGKKKEYTTYAYTTAYPNKDYMGLVVSDLAFYARGWKEEKETGIRFRAIPGGHEFSSLLLAVLNADGKGKNLPDEGISRRIKALQGPIRLQTYVSLTCTNCPDIVQALNVVALLNPHITHDTIDGAVFQEEADALKIQAVPSVYANGKPLHVGRGSLGELLKKLEDTFGSLPQDNAAPTLRGFDTLVLGGGPAGVSAAIYSARKGLRVAIIAERIGGQVKETVGIENLISVPQTTGSQLADALRTHMGHYPIEIFEDRKIEKAELQGKKKKVFSGGGETFTAPAVIIATGASWRKLNVEGEAEYIGRGVAFCPHCDGPFYQGKHVAVIGGGNSGIEAAIDLAGICRKVTVFEFADTLKADQVLQEKAGGLHRLPRY